ncbi:MAG: 50S ribosomal protein L11 methyltransferase [Desulfuromonadaceae bacterium]|nr:50S ribosomal protein L11 methyltransferase [Desulfuromonadaceae bacterium]
MTDKWLEMTLKIPVCAADLVCQELTELGSCGAIVEERVLDTFVPPPPEETDGDFFSVKAFFPWPSSVPDLLETVKISLTQRLRMWSGYALPDLVWREVGHEDWAEGWKQHFLPTRIGRRLVVKPSWDDYQPAPEDVVVTLDPGMAFGTGTHGTTHLCLLAVAEVFDSRPVVRRVLDVGTGSGILAIAAAALGAEFVLACDIDPVACDTARENAAVNAVVDRVQVTQDDLSLLPGDFDVIVANILAEENVRLASELVTRLADGGLLILSGILQEKVPLVTAGFSAFPLSAPDIRLEEEWACLIYRHQNG